MYYRHRIPFLPINNYELNPEIVKAIPEKTCRRFKVIGIDRFEGTGNTKIFTIGMVNPENEKARASLEKKTGCIIRPFKIDKQDWKNIINTIYERIVE